MRNCIIILYGPTAVGKSDFADLLATRLPCEIINVDVGQFYTPLSIGTAKPEWIKSATPQHLFDILSEPRTISVAEYRDQVLPLIQEVWTRGNLPVLVGGSGFYIKSLFFPPSIGSTFSRGKHSNTAKSWQELYAVDPARARSIHPNDTYRINRALDIFYEHGQKPSEIIPRYQPIGSFCFVNLIRDRHDLYERINKRANSMVQQGWLSEVARLQHTQWEPFLKTKKLIGYDDILEYLANPSDENQCKLLEQVAKKTRNYAKRQITFGKQLYEQLEKVTIETADTRSACVQFDLTSGDLELYINQLSQRLQAIRCFDKIG